MSLTKRQREILSYLGSYAESNGYAPSFEEIAAQFNYNSLATVHEHLTNLERKGYIRRSYNESRAIEILPSDAYPRAVELPLLGTVAAGAPIEAVESNETIAVPGGVSCGGAAGTTCCRVRGNSMIDEQIRDGDFVVVHERKTADNGEMVIALLNGAGATVKKLYRERDGRIRLQPANDSVAAHVRARAGRRDPGHRRRSPAALLGLLRARLGVGTPSRYCELPGGLPGGAVSTRAVPARHDRVSVGTHAVACATKSETAPSSASTATDTADGNVGSTPRDVDRCRGIERDGASRPARAVSREDCRGNARVGGRVAAARSAGDAAAESEAPRIDASTRARHPAAPLRPGVGPSGEISSRPGSPCTTSACVISSDLSAAATSASRCGSATPMTWRRAPAGLASGTHQVHERRHAKLAADRRDVAHRGVHDRGEHEDDAGIGENLREDRHGCVERDPQRLEQVGTAAPGCIGAVAMLGDPHPCSRGDEGRDGGNIESRHRAATRPAGVDELLRMVRRQAAPSRVAAHAPRRPIRPAFPRGHACPAAVPPICAGVAVAGHHGIERLGDRVLAQDSPSAIVRSARGDPAGELGGAHGAGRGLTRHATCASGDRPAARASTTSAITSASSRTRSTSSSTNTPRCARLVRFTTPTSSLW